jgi:hypothetical protein
LAENTLDFLNGNTKSPKYFDYSKKELTEHWTDRWLKMRKTNQKIIDKVFDFEPEQFKIG